MGKKKKEKRLPLAKVDKACKKVKYKLKYIEYRGKRTLLNVECIQCKKVVKVRQDNVLRGSGCRYCAARKKWKKRKRNAK